MIEKSNAIATLFNSMKAHVGANETASLQTRLDLLKALRAGVLANKEKLIAAIDEDFDGRSSQESKLADIIPTLGAIDYAIKNLAKWMQPQKRRIAPQFMPAKNRLEFHPKGIVLIISPWNYPFSLSLLPLASALAAGNRVILKPSECSAHT